MKRLNIMTVPLLMLCLLTSGCSVFMAANRASYRGDINVIQLGVQRSAVIAELGQPDNFSTLETAVLTIVIPWILMLTIPGPKL